MEKMTAFDYTRIWFDFVYENPDLASGNHTAVYLWQIELCNRLGWPEKFGSPTKESMNSCGIKSYNTYIKCLRELLEWGFIKMVKESKNQHTANVIALSKFDKAQYKALDKALIKHRTKQVQSTIQSDSESDDSVIKPLNNKTDKPTNKETNKQGFEIFWELYGKKNDRMKCEKAFSKLNEDDVKNLLEKLPAYVSSTPDLQYRKNPLTYLNGRCWEDGQLFSTPPKIKILQRKHFTSNEDYLQWCKENNLTPELL